MSEQPSPRLLVAGCATVLLGLGLYLLRRTSWRAASEALAETAGEARRLRVLVQWPEAWLLHAFRRVGPPRGSKS